MNKRGKRLVPAAILLSAAAWACGDDPGAVIGPPEGGPMLEPPPPNYLTEEEFYAMESLVEITKWKTEMWPSSMWVGGSTGMPRGYNDTEVTNLSWTGYITQHIRQDNLTLWTSESDNDVQWDPLPAIRGRQTPP